MKSMVSDSGYLSSGLSCSLASGVVSIVFANQRSGV